MSFIDTSETPNKQLQEILKKLLILKIYIKLKSLEDITVFLDVVTEIYRNNKKECLQPRIMWTLTINTHHIP